MEKITEKIVKTFGIQYDKNDLNRTAEVVFEEGKFSFCKYNVKSSPCDETDWIWLGELSTTIKRLIEREKPND